MIYRLLEEKSITIKKGLWVNLNGTGVKLWHRYLMAQTTEVLWNLT